MNILNWVGEHFKSIVTGRGAINLAVAAFVLVASAMSAGAATCDPPPSGLTDWWQAEGNVLDSVGTNNGTLQGGATANGVGEVGQAFSFNGTTAYISIPDSPAFHPQVFTIEAWVKFNSLSSTGSGGSPAGDQYIVFKQNSQAGNFEGFDLSKTRISGKDVFRFLVTSASAQTAEIDSTTAIVTNTWYHLAAVRGSNYTQLYVNGALAGQLTVAFPQDYGTLPLFFGSSGESYWDHKLSGLLDEVSLYNRPLASNEIAAIFAAGPAGKCTSPQPPVVAVPPQSQSVAVGSNAVFAVTATGTAPLSYQWLFNSAPITGATNTSVTIASVQTNNAGNYAVFITNSVTSTTSVPAVLTVLTPPVIALQPLSTTNNAGTTAIFSGAATGSGTLNFQWQFNGSNLANNARISGAQTASLTISNVAATDAGSYLLRVSNIAGATNSAPASLSVNGPPVITAQPRSIGVIAGNSASFSVGATGTPPLFYQWQFNGANLTDGGQFSGSATSNLTITGTVPTNAGLYSVVVSNVVNFTISSNAALAVTVPGACDPPPVNLVDWWPGEGNANDIIGTNNGTLQAGATASGVGEVGQAFSFNGTTAYVSIPDSPAFHPTNLTVEAWVLFSSLNSTASGGSPAGDQYIVFKQNSRAGNFEGFDLSKTRKNGQDVFRFLVTSSAGVSVEADSTTPIATNVWYHVAGVRGPSTLQVYVNGALAGSASVSFAQDYGTLPLFFGSSGESYWDHKLSGELDEVSLYNRALTSNEIAAIYAAGSGGKCIGAQPPSVTVNPPSQSVAVGSNAVFTATASGTPPLSYQWLFNGAPIPGATGTNLTVTNVQSTNAGSYAVVVTNAANSTTSAPPAVLTVLTPPVITLQPAGATVNAGSTVVLAAGATGSAPLNYQWKLNGANVTDNSRISGSLTSTLTISNSLVTDTGSYVLFVSNAAGSTNSSPAVVTVNGPPGIISLSPSQIVTVGANVNLIVNATGTQPLTYQWLINSNVLSDGGDITGSLSSNLNFSSAQLTDSGFYQVVVSNVAGSITSVPISLMVNPPPTAPVIVTSPLGQTVTAGTNVTFTVIATGTAPLAFQWKKNNVTLGNGGNVSGATSSNLTLSNVTTNDTASYFAVVTNAAGSTNSATAALTVNVAPAITSQPVSVGVMQGASASFTVGASGTPPPSIQWRFNGVPLTNGGQFAGVTATTLTITNVTTNNAGNYSVLATNVAGVAISSNGVLAVTVPGSCDPSPANLVGWWPADGNTTDVVGGNNGTLQGGATASALGEVGPAFGFNGTTAYVSVPDSPVFHPTNLTVEAWVKFTGLDSTGSGNSPPGDQYLVFKQNSRTGNFEGFDLSKTRINGQDVFRFVVTSAQAASVEVDSTTPVATNVWYHVAGVRGPNTLQLYVNGVLAASASVGFPEDYGTLPLFFGSSGNSFWDHKLNGSLDEVSLYNRALTASEIAAIYAAGSGGKCKGAVGPTIAGQPGAQIYHLGGSAAFTVVAAGTQPLTYQWYRDSVKLTNSASVSGATAATLSLVNLQPTDIGNYTVVVANALGSVTSQPASLNTGIPPANDNFASAQAISGSSGAAAGNNANATKEAGEPNHAGNSGGASVWYTWTAPSTSPVTFDTCLSDFDTLLAVYTGSTLSGLSQIAANDNVNSNNNRSRLTFTPVSGTVYHIAVDGANGANGNLTLRWAQANVALPDLSVVASAVNPSIVTQTFDPSSCAVEEGLIQAGTRTIIRFTTETENSGGADLFFGDPSTNSLFVWAPCHAHYHFQNYMSYRLKDLSGNIVASGLKVGFCVLDVFRWSSGAPNSAKYSCTDQGIQVGWGDVYDSTLDGQWIDITGVPAGNYNIEIECNPQGIIQEANYGNNVIDVPLSIGNPSAPPLNDNFASAQALLGGFSTVSGNNANATKQAGEPNHAGNAGGHSVWYTWTAPSTKSVTIDTINSSFNTLLAVYTGSALNNLQVVASNDDLAPGTQQSQVTFNAVAGTTYQIAVDGYNGATGSIVLTLNQTIQNDNLANGEFIGGVSGIAYGSTTGATKEAGEPNHAGNPGGASIWYLWTAPINGTVTFNTLGSTFNTLLAVYTGPDIAHLTLVGANDDLSSSNQLSSVTFTAAGLTRYNIAIDGYNGATGDTTLNWNLVGTGPQLATRASSAARLNYTFLNEGEFQLNISGPPQQTYRIETSCDLVHWTPNVTTLADATGHAYFTDKTTMKTAGQSPVSDPVCTSAQIAGANGARTRYYRAIPTSPTN